MKIKYITIHNFRGIDKREKLEVSNLNTFVGKNDSGKSIILRALDCFFEEKKFDNKDVFKGKPYDENTIIELSFLPSIEIDDLALDSNKLLTIKKEWVSSDGKPKTYYLSYDFTEEKYQDLWNKKEQDLNRIISDLGEVPERSGRGKKNLLRIEQIRKLLHEKERRDTYHVLGDILKEINETYEVVLPAYSLFDAEKDLDIEATSFQSQFKHIITAFFESAKVKTDEIEEGLNADLSNEFEEIRGYMSKNVSGLKKINPTTEFDWSKSLKGFDLSLEFEGEVFDVPISHKGTGFKRLLMVAYFEYLASKRNIANQIFAIEEPETYLHPSAQLDLLNSIIEISENSQFFLTTHSPVFAGATDGENSILVTKDGKGISHYSKGEENIITQIIEELGIRPDYNLLKNTKFIIFVEGPNDVQFVNIAAKTIFNKDLRKDRIACVIGGGSSLSNYVALNLFKEICNNSNKYAVLVDGDNGDKTKQKEKVKIKDQCKADGALFCELSKRDIENYCCPDTIKSVYNIGAVIQIDDKIDVEPYLKGLGLPRFKSGKNIKVFESMTKAEWDTMDSKSEIRNFIEEIYNRI
jgi:predicted ATP-dependent endonuclease of OLD family